MDVIVSIFLPVFFVLYLLVAFVLPTYRTYKSTGINPLRFGKADNAHDYVGKVFKVVFALIPIMIALFLLGKDIYTYLLPAVYLEITALKYVGMFFCLLSLVWTSIAQFQMGNSWRIGIDEENKTTLRQAGLFSVSRNPIFLGMVVTMVGFFLVLPNAVSLLILFTGFILIQIQIRLEEEFLYKQHGADYSEYCRKVRRWL